MARVYWIDLFTAETWQEVLDHGGDVSGFSEKRRTVVAKIPPGGLPPVSHGADLPRRREQLPQQFDPVTNRTIELIDVLWLDGDAIVATFEIESTTSIYSGLLRMSDLLSRQPNIAIPLFLVAPEERREKVIAQVNRPTFEHMTPPLVDVCRYISFEGLREALAGAKHLVSFLKPAWLQKVSDPTP
jgi:hypothetical protein